MFHPSLKTTSTPPSAPAEVRAFAHVPTLGDHYSPATGSAVMTIIYQLARQHDERRGRTCVVVSRGTRHDYDVGHCVEVEPSYLQSKWQKGMDACIGRLGFGRPLGARTYRHASEGIARDFAGSIFIHNNPVAIRMFKDRHPHAQVCLWAHNRLFDTYSRHEVRRVEAACDRLICVSEYIAGDLIQRLGRESKKIRVVHNGVDIDRFQPADALGDGGPPIILFVGRVQPVKGVDLLVQSALALAAKGRSFRVRIVGSSGFCATDPLTPHEQRLREMAFPLGDRITFVPFVDRIRIAAEYRKASIFCVPARWDEPFGMTTLEGMACGLPTVVAERGGIREAAGDAALYFRPPDTDALARHLDLLLCDEAVRRDWAGKARRRAEEFSWARQYEVLLAATAHSSNMGVA
jgi:glycosyltransferase involved in cell wall biosynthesis